MITVSLPNGIALRRARPGDAPGVRSLVEQLGYAPDSRAFSETFTQVARHPEAAVFVLAEGTRVVGYLAVSHRPQIRLGGRVAVIDELAVDPAYGERGLGSHLLAQALETLAQIVRELLARDRRERRQRLGVRVVAIAGHRLDHVEHDELGALAPGEHRRAVERAVTARAEIGGEEDAIEERHPFTVATTSRPVDRRNSPFRAHAVR